jgi:parallel beta-helix repeat protein
MAAPTFVGAGTVAVTTLDDDTANYPAGWAADDLLLLLVENAGDSLTVDAGWTSAGTPQLGTGTGLHVWYRVAQSGDGGSVGYHGSGINHMQGVVLAYRGVDTTTPLDVTSVGGTASASTSVTFPSITTVTANCMIVFALAAADDRATGNDFGSWTNANLTSLTERVDANTAQGNDGALGAADGVKATAGATGTTTASIVTSAAKAYMTIALRPSGGTAASGTVSATLPAVTSALSGSYEGPSGTLTSQLPAVTSSLTGAQDSPPEGVVTASLPAVTSALAGESDGPSGSMNCTLPSLSSVFYETFSLEEQEAAFVRDMSPAMINGGLYSVKSYNAKGDNASDDFGAIQAALDAAHRGGGGLVTVPKGIYRMYDAPLKIHENTHIKLLPGAEIHRYNDTGGSSLVWNGDGGQNRGQYTGHGNIIIEGGVWDMRCSNSDVTLSSDDFTRSNTSAPHALGVMTSGQTWFEESARDDGSSTAGGLGITSNTAYAPAAGTNISTVFAWPDGLVAATMATAGNAGIVFRMANSQNYWQYVRHTDGNARLSVVVDGTETVITPTATTAVSSSSILKVVFYGDTIKAYVGSTLTHDTTDAAGFTANRKVGLVIYDTTARMDSFISSASIWQDTFNRSNSTTTLGTASSNGLWTTQAGTLGINSNQAYAPGAGTNVATVDATSENNPTVTMATAGNAGLVFRFVDANNYWYYVRHTDGNARLVKKVAGVDTVITPTTPTAIASADVLSIQVVGYTIRAYVGTTATHEVEDSANYAGTKVGIVSFDTTARLDSFDSPVAWGGESSGACFSFGHGDNITWRGTTIRDVSQNSHCIEINSSRNVTIEDCIFPGTVDYNGRQSECIQLDLAKNSSVFGGFGPYDDTACKNVQVRGCSFVQSYMPGTQAWIRGVGSHNATVGAWHDTVRVVDNYFDVTQRALRAYNWNNVTFSNNTVVSGWGIEIRPIWTGSTGDTVNRVGTQTSASQDITGVTVTGNTFDATGSTAGSTDATIRVFGESTGHVQMANVTGNVIKGTPSIGISMEYVDYGTCTGNTVTNTGGDGIQLLHSTGCTVASNTLNTLGATGIDVNVSSGCLIQGNRIRLAQGAGVYLEAGSSGNTIASNFIKGIGRAASSTAAGVSLSGNAGNTFNSIIGNRIEKEGDGGNEGQAAIRREGGTAAGNTVIGNSFQGWSTTHSTCVAQGSLAFQTNLDAVATANNCQS